MLRLSEKVNHNGSEVKEVPVPDSPETVKRRGSPRVTDYPPGSDFSPPTGDVQGLALAAQASTASLQASVEQSMASFEVAARSAGRTLDLLRGVPGQGAYWFRPDEANTGYFRISFGGRGGGSIGSGCHTNTVRAALRASRRHPSSRPPRLLVEVEPGTAHVGGMGPAELKQRWSEVFDLGRSFHGAYTDGVPYIAFHTATVVPLLPKNLRPIGAQRMTLGPEDTRREAWVWVVEFVEKGKRA